MSRCKYLLAAGFAATLLVSAGHAADMPRIPMPMKGGPEVTEFFSNWYLRLDGGYRFSKLSGGQALGSDFTATSFKNEPTIGGGIGYKWNWFRADITLDYGNRPPFIGDTVPGGLNGPYRVTANLPSYTTLANAYIDLGSWWGFTPYVGAGIGASFFKPTNFLLNDSLGTQFSTIAGDGRWRFTWAAMAGMSYAFSPIFLIDVGYRYLDLGEARSSVNMLAPPFGDVTYGSWTAQEVRVGLRYLIP